MHKINNIKTHQFISSHCHMQKVWLAIFHIYWKYFACVLVVPRFMKVWVENKACLWSASRHKRGPMPRYRKCTARTVKKRCAREHVYVFAHNEYTYIYMYTNRYIYIFFNEVVPWIFEEIFPAFFTPRLLPFSVVLYRCAMFTRNVSFHYLPISGQNPTKRLCIYQLSALKHAYNELSNRVLLKMTRQRCLSFFLFFISTYL